MAHRADALDHHMEVFHVVIDTSMMRRVPFQHADFVRLLLQSQLGKVKIYIPHIAFEDFLNPAIVADAIAGRPPAIATAGFTLPAP